MTEPPSLPARPPVGAIYPDMMGSPPGRDAPVEHQAFRLSEIRRVREDLERDAHHHGATRRRYKRAANILTYAGIASNTAAAGCGGAAVATLAGGITAPASLVLGACSLCAGGTGTACPVAGKMLDASIAKHERIETTARTRHDAVSAVVSKAAKDRVISHDEYAMVLQQAEQYRRQKAEYRAAARTKRSKNDIRSQVRDELNEALQHIR